MDVLDLDSPSGFDIITLWDSFEHLPNIEAYVQHFHRMLNANGLLIFSTPNTLSLEWLTAGKRHPQILPPGHVNLFSSRNIGNFLQRNGFLVSEIHTPNASLDCSYLESNLNDPHILNGCGAFVATILTDPTLAQSFKNYLVDHQLAGNMVVIARKQ